MKYYVAYAYGPHLARNTISCEKPIDSLARAEEVQTALLKREQELNPSLDSLLLLSWQEIKS